MDPTTVGVCARDPISRAGLISQLRTQRDVKIEDSVDEKIAPQVVVMALDFIDREALQELRRIQRSSTTKAVLVASELDDQTLYSAAECGVTGVIRRSQATPDHLARVIVAVAQGEGHVPADLLGRLLNQVGALHAQILAPRVLRLTGLSSRESDILRLTAEGYDTREIAKNLAFCERTIKNDVNAIVTRLGVRNRAHAVAVAVRLGLI